MKFLLDNMLGRLARWLRFAGYDAAYPAPDSIKEAAALANAEGRVILTRDRELAESKTACAVYLESVELNEQVKQLSAELDLKLDEGAFLTRCALCNSLLSAAKKEEAKGIVPLGVYERCAEFWYCHACRKFYWKGTHWERIHSTILAMHGDKSK